jgi:hypothetical protein
MGQVLNATPRPLYTLGKSQYPLYRGLGGPQGRSGRVRKISPPPEFDPRTFQPVAGRYTDWAVAASNCSVTEIIFFNCSIITWSVIGISFSDGRIIPNIFVLYNVFDWKWAVIRWQWLLCMYRKPLSKHQVTDKSPNPSNPRYDSWLYLFTLLT